jgi:hypothetical protein
MARIDWAVLCDLAFLDRQDRLCVLGIVRRFPVPRLPLALHQVMLVAHLTDIQPVDEVTLCVTVVGPRGLQMAPTDADRLVIEMAGEYVIVTLRDVPLIEEGVYRFQIGLAEQAVVSVDVPVLSADRAVLADVH